MGSLYTVTAVSGLEYHLDDCTQLFISKMNGILGYEKAAPVDLAAWLQYYAFDSLGAVNFSQMLGFLESGTDVDGICHLDHDQMMYFAVVRAHSLPDYGTASSDTGMLTPRKSSGAKLPPLSERGQK